MAADADGGVEAVTEGVLLAVDSVGDALGAMFAVVHAMRLVARRATVRDTS